MQVSLQWIAQLIMRAPIKRQLVTTDSFILSGDLLGLHIL